MNTHRRISAFCATVAALVVGAVSLAAQDQSELSNGRTPGWSFTPGMSLAAAVDTNVALAGSSPIGRQAHSDKLLIAEPFVQMDFFSKRTELTTGYQGYLRRYMEFDQLNSFDQHGHAFLRRLVSKRLTFVATEDYARVPTTDELDLNGIRFARTGAKRNSASAQLDARLTKFTDLTVKYDNTWVSFDRSDSLLIGGAVNGVSTHLSRRISERVSVGGEYALRYADLNQGTRQLTFQDVGGTAEIRLAPRTSASLGAGYSFLNDRSRDLFRTGPYFRADVTHGTEHATIGAGFERMFVPSFGFGGSSQSQQARAFIRMPLDRNRMYVQGSVSWRRTNPFLVSELPLNTTLLRSTLGYSATRFLRVEAFCTYTRQDTQLAGGKVNRSRVGAQFVISQPMRIQ